MNKTNMKEEDNVSSELDKLKADRKKSISSAKEYGNSIAYVLMHGNMGKELNDFKEGKIQPIKQNKIKSFFEKIFKTF